MKPAKEKAKELVDKFKPMCHNVKHTGILDGLATVVNDEFINLSSAKVCAIIAINEMLEFTKQTVVSSLTIWTEEGHFRDETTIYNSYLLEVKQEIENL
jgi:hypothetical protein